LLDALTRAWPQHWQAIADANNTRPPMAIRVNLLRTSRARYLARLEAAGIPAREVDGLEAALMLEQPVPVTRLPGFADGEVSVQDVSAQLAATLVDPRPGQRVLDACAAPGGKTAHLLERSRPAEVVAVDVDADRLERLRGNLERLRLSAVVVQGDAARPADWWDERQFDCILLDAPCSGSGVIRRHPDIKLLRRPADIEQMAARQRDLLAALWPLLRRGGKLVYATCSVLPRENHQAVAAFLEQQPGARDVTPELPWGRRVAAGWQTLPGEGGGDGFYYACIDKT
jgi:16S rRNA (cytosine967-C5)-methyltransferase